MEQLLYHIYSTSTAEILTFKVCNTVFIIKPGERWKNRLNNRVLKL
jgi:hypothetical protein